MFEIELKAHVENYESTKNTIDTFAIFLGKKQKSDVYWKTYSAALGYPIRVRLREEKTTTPNGIESKNIIVTYKKKELRETFRGDKNISYEVNEENEFTIDNRTAFETILIDTGYTIDLEKDKHVLQWQYEKVLLELCIINNLGNFLELEIINESQDDNSVNVAIKELQDVLIKCNIPLEKIEKKYYSELLREKNT